MNTFRRASATTFPPPASLARRGAPLGAGAASTPVAETDVNAEPLMAWPFVVVLAYFLVDFGRPQTWFPPLGAIKPGMLVFAGGLFALIARKHQFYVPTRAKIMLAFLGLMVIGTPFATNGYWAFVFTKDFAFFLFGAVFPLMTFVNTYARLERLVGWLILIHIPLVIYGMMHSGFGIGAFLGDENDFCLALNVILPYVFFSFYFVKGSPRKIFLILVLGLLLFGITSTKSRGGFLGLLAAAGYCWIASPRKVASLVVLVAVAGPVFAIVPQSYWDEMNTIQTSTENDDTGAQRLYLWNMGWEMFKDHPILGVGPTNFQWNSLNYESEGQQAKGVHVWGKGAHSLYFTLLPEGGIVGLTLLASLLVLGFRDSAAVRRAYKALLKSKSLPPERLQQFYVLNIMSRANDASMIAFLVSGAFLTVLYYPHLWLQAGIGIAIKRSADILLAQPSAEGGPPAPPARRFR